MARAPPPGGPADAGVLSPEPDLSPNPDPDPDPHPHPHPDPGPDPDPLHLSSCSRSEVETHAIRGRAFHCTDRISGQYALLGVEGLTISASVGSGQTATSYSSTSTHST